MGKTAVDFALEFKSKYPGTLSWRVRQHAEIIDLHKNPDETITYAFTGQRTKHEGGRTTTVVALTDKRLIVGRNKIGPGYTLYSITPDLFESVMVIEEMLWGKIIITARNDKFVIYNIQKAALTEIETKITMFMMEEKKKYMTNASNNQTL